MKKISVKVLAEALLLYCLPLSFAIVYARVYRNPYQLVATHLYVISLILFALAALRMFIDRVVRYKALALILVANLYAILLFVFLAYYSLVIIGLRSWGRVITKEFIMSYGGQAREFCQTLNISFPGVVAAIVLAYLAIAVFCYFFLKKFKWTPQRWNVSPAVFGMLMVSLFLFFSYQLYAYSENSWTPSGANREPILLTIHSGEPSEQNHNANRGNLSNARTNQLEKSARQHYHINPGARRHNLVILMVDALRPDNTSLYEYARDTTPNLRQMEKMEGAAKFTNVRSTCGETTCAHASFFGSRFVGDLPDNLFTLQQVLERYGYTTNFIISGNHMEFQNIRSIYGQVDHYFDGSMQKQHYFDDDEVIIDKTRSLPIWDGKPQMLHYHLLSNHILGKRHAQYVKYLPSESYVLNDDGEPDQKFTNFYDNGVRQTDDVIRTLLAILKQKHYLNDALVVVMADHGEALGDHHLFKHTNSVYEELLHIPLLMVPYGYHSDLAAHRTDFVSMVDLAPTVLREFDMPIPDSWVGRPVQQGPADRLSFFEMRRYRGMYDVQAQTHPERGIWKYWVDDDTLEEFAYDLKKDPRETNNVFQGASAAQRERWRALVKLELEKPLAVQ